MDSEPDLVPYNFDAEYSVEKNNGG